MSNDGVRLWVNGQQIINNWSDHAPKEDSGTVALTAGQRYDIRMEFYEGDGTATARLLWSSASVPKAVIPTLRLYSVPAPTTQLTLATNPSGLGLRLDGQSVSTPLNFNSAVGTVRGLEAPVTQQSGGTTYEFVSWSDGGAAIHNMSTPAIKTTYTAMYRVSTSGSGGGSGTGNGLAAMYFDNVNFTGATVTRTDPTVDFDRGASGPAPGIAADFFSVRWTGQVEAPSTGTYTFYTVSNDGVRLWVNGQQIINNWSDHAPKEDSGTVALTAGQRYDIRMEFYEGDGTATARLLWSSASVPKAVIPTSRLYSALGSPTAAGISFQPPAGSVASGVTDLVQHTGTPNDCHQPHELRPAAQTAHRRRRHRFAGCYEAIPAGIGADGGRLRFVRTGASDTQGAGSSTP